MSEVFKTGYKQTEVGVIPEDWEVVLFGAIADIRKEKSSNRSSTSTVCVELEHIEQGTGQLLGFSDVTNGYWSLFC